MNKHLKTLVSYLYLKAKVKFKIYDVPTWDTNYSNRN